MYSYTSLRRLSGRASAVSAWTKSRWSVPHPTKNALPHTDAPAQGDEVSPSARKPKRGAGSSTAQSAETVRSEPSPPLPDLRLGLRSPALFQNCGRINNHRALYTLQAMTRTRSRRLSFASLIASRRTWMIASNSHFLAFKIDQYKPRTSVPKACLTAP